MSPDLSGSGHAWSNKYWGCDCFSLGQKSKWGKVAMGEYMEPGVSQSWVAGFWVLNILSSNGLLGNVLREDRVSLIGIGKIGPSQ